MYQDLGCTGMHWDPGCTRIRDALGSGMHQDALGSGMHWDVLGCTGMYRDAAGCSGMHWDPGCTGMHWDVPGCPGIRAAREQSRRCGLKAPPRGTRGELPNHRTTLRAAAAGSAPGPRARSGGTRGHGTRRDPPVPRSQPPGGTRRVTRDGTELQPPGCVYDPHGDPASARCDTGVVFPRASRNALG